MVEVWILILVAFGVDLVENLSFILSGLVLLLKDFWKATCFYGLVIQEDD